MNKIRLIFILLVVAFSLTGAILFHFIRAPFNSKIDPVPEMKITRIAGNGKIYVDTQPIEGTNLNALKTLDTRQMELPGKEIYIKADEHATMEFLCTGYSFLVRHNSYLHFKSGSNLVDLYNGEFYWEKKGKGKNPTFQVHYKGKETPQVFPLVLSDSGRIKISDTSIELWNYTGKMSFNLNSQDYPVNRNQLFVISESKKGTTATTYDVPSSPQDIDPLDLSRVLSQPDDSVVRFNWNTNPNVTGYIFRLYTSDLRENNLIDRSVDTNRCNVDLLQYEDREFFWEVIPIDPVSQREGAPSKMGHVVLLGSLNEKKNVLKQPTLSIVNQITSGNTVYITGNADPNCTLTINDQVVKIEADTSFVFNITFNTLGLQKIVYILRSPQDIATVETRYVNIADNDNE